MYCNNYTVSAKKMQHFEEKKCQFTHFFLFTVIVREAHRFEILFSFLR